MHENRILIHKLKNFENINSNFLIITLMLFGSILLAISAKVQVPFWPVPMTMQTFVIFLIGMTYSVRLSFATVAFYLFQGARTSCFCSRWRSCLFSWTNSRISLWYVICIYRYKLFSKFRFQQNIF